MRLVLLTWLMCRSDVSDDMLHKVCRCSELVKRSVMMLSLASSSSTMSSRQHVNTPGQCPDTDANTCLHSNANTSTDDAASSQTSSKSTQMPAIALLSTGARQSSQQAVQSVNQAIDELCHVIQQHLSDHHHVITSASATSATRSRRMLPVVPGTSSLPPGAALLATRCQSARSGDRTLSKHISMMCFPAVSGQHSNEL